MKKILFLVVAALALGTSLVNLNSCSNGPGTTSVQYDTIYQHYWDPESTGAYGTLIGVRFPTLQVGTAVGAGGIIVHTTDGGSTWSPQNSGASVDLYGVSFSDVNTGFVVGSFGVVIKTTDGGNNWQPISVDIDVQFRNVLMIGPNTAYAIGARYFDVDNTKGYIYKTTDGGSTWKALTLPTTPGLYGISFIDATTGWVSGWDGTILKTTDGGATWTRQTSNIPKTEQVCQISFGDANHGIAVGLDAIAGIGDVPSAGFIATTSDGGATWVRTASTAVDGVYMADAKHAMVVGYNGTIMETNDAGATWSTKSVGSLRLVNIFLNDPNNGAMIGENGMVYMLGPH